MTTEVKALIELYHAVFIVWIPFTQFLQNIDLHQSLLMEALLVPNDLDRHKNAGFMVDAPNDLTEASLTKQINHLVSIREMVAIDNVVVTTLVVITEVGIRGV